MCETQSRIVARLVRVCDSTRVRRARRRRRRRRRARRRDAVNECARGDARSENTSSELDHGNTCEKDHRTSSATRAHRERIGARGAARGIDGDERDARTIRRGWRTRR